MGKNMSARHDVIAAKRQLRKETLACRDAIPLCERIEKSRHICEMILQMECYRQADALLAYVDYQSEVITKPILEAALLERKPVFVPKVEGEEMAFYQITDLSELVEGYKGIREPAGGRAFDRQAKEAFILMPGAVFDKHRHRIGYGKGFYDRYIAHLAQMEVDFHLVALGFSCQMHEEIPYEEHDIRPDMIMTEEGIYE